MREETTYRVCKDLQKAGLFTAVQNAEYWATRADYLTIYEYILTNYPTKPRGYQRETAKALSFSKLGGGYCGLLDATDVKTAVHVMESLIYI